MTRFLTRFRSAFDKATHRHKTKANTSHQRPSLATIPIPIFIRILVHCDLSDIYSLLLTCHTIHHHIAHHESTIAHEYLHSRRTIPTSTQEDVLPAYTESLSPGDDLTFISDLFPPPPPQYVNNAGDDLPDSEYSLGYLADLTRCWSTCLRLSYYLADYVVKHHLETDEVARELCEGDEHSKTEREFVYSKAVGVLQERFLLPTAYLVFFLESTASPTPGSPTSRSSSESSSMQSNILQQPPFSNSSTLLSTHHYMTLLCKTVLHLISPEITTENWLSLLLTTSTLERIVEFFAAVAADADAAAAHKNESGESHSHWSRRMEFMWRVREDYGEVLGHVKGHGVRFEEKIKAMPRLREVWFDAAEREMDRRGLIPHDAEEGVTVLHGSVVEWKCSYCEGEAPTQ